MACYAIDAPTLLHLVEHELTVDPAHRLVAPHSIRSEAMGLLLRDVRRGLRSDRQALELHERMTELKMRLLGDRVSRRTAWQIAVAHEWASLRDAECLAIARLQADAFVTVDADLAGKADTVTNVAPLEALLAEQ
jgi:predicted nucleic acid-binding protein